MDFNSFIRYLAFLRWSRLLAFVFAFLGCFIIGYHFLIEQKNHRQLEWQFKNVSHINACTMELEPDRVYEVNWEYIDGKTVVPTELIVDDEIYDTLNFFSQPYKAKLKFFVKAYINKFLTSPMKLRVRKPTKFSIIFRVYTNLNTSENPGSFIGKWFDSWFDPVTSVKWYVRDITDTYNNDFLLFDGSIEITKNR